MKKEVVSEDGFFFCAYWLCGISCRMSFSKVG